MIFPVFSIRDDKVGFLQPTCDSTVASAKRGFCDAIRNPSAGYHLHPGDFSLYHIGHFDTDSGRIDALDAPQFVCSGADFAQEGEA